MLIDAIVLVTVGVAAVLLPSLPAYRSRLVDRLARSTRVQVPTAYREGLQAKLSRRARGMGTGILLGGVVLLVLALVWDGQSRPDGGGYLVVSLMWVLGAAGLVVAELSQPAAPGQGPRAARLRTPGLTDYLPREALLVSGALAAAGLLALLGALALGRTRWFDAGVLWRSPVPVVVVAVPVLAVLSWWAIRRVLDAPQPARDEAELYWQDAVRANTVTALLMPAPVVGLLGMIVTGAALDDAASAAAESLGQVGPAWSTALLIAGYAVPFVLVIVLALSPLLDRSEREQFQTRLWDGAAHAGTRS